MSESKNGNGIDDLRALLFETLRGVKEGKISIERGKAVGELTQVIVNTAKIEVEFLKATKGKAKASAFFPPEDESEKPALPSPAASAPDAKPE
jgi:hypothetical protein